VKKAFVTYLGNDRFLPGILALNRSLNEHDNNEDLVILVGKDVSASVVKFLKEKAFCLKMVRDIANPYASGNDSRGKKYMYTKLRAFELTEYEKIIYLDADMVICGNIQSLFDKEHMSAVIAGGVLPENGSWVDFNSGLMVIQPELATFNSMLGAVNTLQSDDEGDQGFLNSFFSEWKKDERLHLDHKFNVPSNYIDEYCALSDFEFTFIDNKLLTTNVEVLHFWGSDKPWDYEFVELSKKENTTKYEQSLKLWWYYFYNAL
jgi:lipopolysaccharide biosynthesis glycosyltransferase